jgi:hypothetical protein
VRSSRSNRSTRPSTADSPALRIADLRRARALVPGEMTYGDLRFEWSDGNPLLFVDYVADMRNPKSAWLDLRHRLPGEPPSQEYRIELGLAPCCCAPGRWSRRCPVRNTFSPVLFCPAGADRFLSSRAHGLRVPSDSYASHDRPLHRFRRAKTRLEAALPKPYRGGRGASRPTLDMLRAERDHADTLAMLSLLRRSGVPGY